MDDKQIINAINNAKRGIEQYIEIMNLFQNVNVALSREFQRKYNAFYRVQRKKEQWYFVYYQHMENQKGRDVTFSSVLRYLHNKLGSYEFSFSSKLVATHNPLMPIWDRHVLGNFNISPPPYKSNNRFEKADIIYNNINAKYNILLRSAEGDNIINLFNKIIGESNVISNIKKLDFVYWQMRPNGLKERV